MKNKGVLIILLFTFGFMLMIPNVKADTFAGRYSMPNFDSSGHPLNKNNNVFTFDLGLGSMMKYFTYANPTRTFDADYIVFQLNLISVTDDLVISDTNYIGDSNNATSDAVIIYPDGTTANILLPSHGFTTHYSEKYDTSFSLYVNAMYNNDSFIPCEIMSSFGNSATYKCPVMDKNAKFVGFQFRTDSVGGATGLYHAKISFLDMLYLYKYNSNSDVSAAIRDQTDQQHKDSQAQLEEQKKQTDAITSESDDVESSDCGLICKIGGVFKGIIELPGKLISLLIDALKSLFIPKDMSFIEEFMSSIENKLGFIASIPMSIIRFTLDLATASWEEFNSVTFPTISIFGYHFWETQEIDLTEAINIFKPFKYITDIICVTLFCRTLLKWYERFNGGGS